MFCATERLPRLLLFSGIAWEVDSLGVCRKTCPARIIHNAIANVPVPSCAWDPRLVHHAALFCPRRCSLAVGRRRRHIRPRKAPDSTTITTTSSSVRTAAARCGGTRAAFGSTTNTSPRRGRPCAQEWASITSRPSKPVRDTVANRTYILYSIVFVRQPRGARRWTNRQLMGRDRMECVRRQLLHTDV